MEIIWLTLLILYALLPTTIAASIFAYQRRNRLWARIWTVLASIGGLGIIAMSAYTSLSGLSDSTHTHAGEGVGILWYFLSRAWMVQLLVIGIVAIARGAAKHVAAGAVAPSEIPDDSLAAPAARREEAPPRRGFSWILWIGIALTALFVFTPVSDFRFIGYLAWMAVTFLRFLTLVVAPPLLPLALAFIVAGHLWRAHEWAWYMVAIAGALGLLLNLLVPSLVEELSPVMHEFSGLRGCYEDWGWAYVYPAIVVLTVVCCVVTLILMLARANPMYRWAFTWATLGYILLILVGWSDGWEAIRRVF